MVFTKICIDFDKKEVSIELMSDADGRKIGEESYANVKLVEISGVTRLFLDRVVFEKTLCIFSETSGRISSRGSVIAIE